MCIQIKSYVFKLNHLYSILIINQSISILKFFKLIVKIHPQNFFKFNNEQIFVFFFSWFRPLLESVFLLFFQFSRINSFWLNFGGPRICCPEKCHGFIMYSLLIITKPCFNRCHSRRGEKACGMAVQKTNQEEPMIIPSLSSFVYSPSVLQWN